MATYTLLDLVKSYMYTLRVDPEPAKSDEICAATAVELFKPLNLFGTSYYCHLLQYLSSLFLCCIFLPAVCVWRRISPQQQHSSTAAQNIFEGTCTIPEHSGSL